MPPTDPDCLPAAVVTFLCPQVHGAAAAVQQGGEGGDRLGGPAGHHAFRSWGSGELPDGLHASGQAAHHQRTDAPRTHASSGNTVGKFEECWVQTESS